MAMNYSENVGNTFLSKIRKFPADYSAQQELTFKQAGWYLKFCALFMKNMSIIWTRKDKINKINVILWKTKDIMQHALKLQLIFLLPEYIKLIPCE